MQDEIIETPSQKGLIFASFVWLVALGAALLAAFLRGVDTQTLLPYAGAASIPALMAFVLWPKIHRDWAQIIIMLSWLALAIMACIAIAFIPMAVLFLCAPLAATLFDREKIIEAMVLAAVFAAFLFYAGENGVFPDSIASEAQAAWARQAGLTATIAMLIAAMFGAVGIRPKPAVEVVEVEVEVEVEVDKSRETVSDLIDALPGAVMHMDANNRLLHASVDALEYINMREDMSVIPATAVFAFDKSSQNRLLSLVDWARSENARRTETLTLDAGTQDSVDVEVIVTPVPDNEVVVYLAKKELPVVDFAPMPTLLTPDTIIADADDVEVLGLGEENRDEIEALQSEVSLPETVKEDSLQSDTYDTVSGRNLFFAGVSHELRTPLNAIIGFSDMMRSRLFGPLPNKYSEYADLIHDSGQHMLDLIGDVLDLSKVEAGKYELHYDTFDAADIIRSTIKMTMPMADAAKLRLDAEFSTHDDLIIHADRKALRQILLNLISNAIKFTPKGGRVVVAAKIIADTLNITVSDNGAGINPDELSQIGKPYTQGTNAQLTEHRGSGLGLSLVSSLTELHGGRMSIASQPEEGTTVDIYLPLMSD